VAGRSEETDYCTDGWMMISMEDTVVLAKAILIAEDAEDSEETVVCGMFQLLQTGSLFY
jgi:hypothetical protein